MVGDVTNFLVLVTSSYRAPPGGNTALIKATDLIDVQSTIKCYVFYIDIHVGKGIIDETIGYMWDFPCCHYQHHLPSK